MRRLPASVSVLAGLLAIYLVAPLVAGLANMGTADWAGADVYGLAHATLVSVGSATVATVLVALGGVPLAYLLARRPTRFSALLGFVVQLPLALPPLSSGVLLLFLLGYASPLGQATGGTLTDSFAGIVLAEAFVSAPFLIIAARSAFAEVDPLLEDVVATLGHAPGAVFRRVSLALAWRAIVAGMLLTWLRAFGEFGATVMVAYHPYSLPVFTYVAFGSRGLPAMLPVLVPTAIAALAVMGMSKATIGQPRRRGGPRDGVPPAGSMLEPIAANPLGPVLALRLRRRLNDFDLSVDWRTKARRLAILGASGSGKSMMLRLIAGLDSGEDCSIAFGDRTLDALPPERRDIAYVPQSYGLLPNLTVADQVRLARDCDAGRAAHWTARLDLTALEDRRSSDLSLGQQQRVALARAMSRRDAGLILLDEPFAALDTPLRIRLREEMLALQQEIAVTTVLVTHDPAEAMLLADELLLIDGGRVLQTGSVRDVYARPVSEMVARLLGATLIGRGRVTDGGAIDIGGGVRLGLAGPPLAPGLRVGWATRAHQLRFVSEEGHRARVLRRGPLADGQRRVTVQFGDATLVFYAGPSCPPEGACAIALDAEALQVWPASASS